MVDCPHGHRTEEPTWGAHCAWVHFARAHFAGVKFAGLQYVRLHYAGVHYEGVQLAEPQFAEAVTTLLASAAGSTPEAEVPARARH